MVLIYIFKNEDTKILNIAECRTNFWLISLNLIVKLVLLWGKHDLASFSVHHPIFRLRTKFAVNGNKAVLIIILTYSIVCTTQYNFDRWNCF